MTDDVPEFLTAISPEGEKLTKDRCPICGAEVEIKDGMGECANQHYGDFRFPLEELITDEDDYAWCV